jgi:hypothetical protein
LHPIVAQGLAAAQGLQGLQGMAAQGLQGLHPIAAQGVHGLQSLAAQGLAALQLAVLAQGEVFWLICKGFAAAQGLTFVLA